LLAAVLAALPALACRSAGAAAPVHPASAAAMCPVELQPPPCDLPQRDYPFTNLVLEGGGVKGVAYPGALAVLEQQGVLPQVRRVAGTSAGSIGAALLALGYTPQELRDLLVALDFRRFEDGSELGGPLRLLDDFGWYQGDFFLDWMRERVRAKTGDPDTTFAELQAVPGRYRELYVIASDLSRRRSQVFSHRTSPDLPVARAVRASMSIPLFFEATWIDGGRFGDQGGRQSLFVDGGIFANFPIWVFDRPPFVEVEQVNRATLGLFLANLDAPRDPWQPIIGFREYAKELVEALLEVQVNAFANSPDDRVRTVVIDDLGVRTTDFEVDQTTKCALVRQGAIAACAYLRDWRPPG
jgi:NTE family protein